MCKGAQSWAKGSQAAFLQSIPTGRHSSCPGGQALPTIPISKEQLKIGTVAQSRSTDNIGKVTMASQGEIAAVEVYTTNEPVMAKEIEYKGMLLVSKVKSSNMFSNIGSGSKVRIKGLSKLTSDIREELLLELREKAVQAGANAIVGLRMETNSLFEGVLDMVVYGTAVYFQR